ncbi:oligosaccharide repeat unit polymerase [candidate division WOR-3 bacterium]|nr:oligosaccharide repeat unit polymerase [candidate division WOR-3 bacterium]
MTEILYGILSIIFMVGGIAVGKIRFGSYIFNPPGLYSLIWGIGLIGLNFRISSEFYPLSPQANNIFFVAWFFFLLGVTSFGHLACTFQARKNQLSESIEQIKKFYLVSLSTSILFLLVMLFHILSYVSIYQYIMLAPMYRLAYFYADLPGAEIYALFPYSGAFYNLIVYPLLLISAIYGACYANIVNPKWILSYLPIGGAMIWSMITLGRFPVFIVGSIYLFAWMFTERKKVWGGKTLRIGLLIGISILFVTFLENIRLGEMREITKSYAYSASGMKVPYLIMNPVYSQYGGLVLFSVCLPETRFRESYYGGITFKEFLWIRGIVIRHILGDKDYRFNPDALVDLQEGAKYIGNNIKTNAFQTYLHAPWHDFRYLGIIMFPFIMGFLCCLPYRFFLRTGSFYMFGLYLYLIVVFILVSTIVWRLSDIFYSLPIFYLVAGYILWKWNRSHPKKLRD